MAGELPGRERPDISLIVPFANEAGALARTLQSLVLQELEGLRAEVLLIDGESSDTSAEIAASYAGHPHPGLTVRVLRNERRSTPTGFNLGIRESTATYVGFGGAHTEYPRNYLREAHRLLNSGLADVVGGGFTDYLPAGPDPASIAISYLYRSPVGAGVAAYHRRTVPGYVDTVYGGFYRREVFDRVGVFNETLVRNQDNELNARVRAAGFRIYFDPALSTAYIHKPGVGTFLRRAYNFGRYHPRSWLATPEGFRLRHFLPLVFLIYMVAVVAGVTVLGAPGWILWPLVVYLLALTVSAAHLTLRHRHWAGLLTIPLFFLFHISYGVGIAHGIGQMALQWARGDRPVSSDDRLSAPPEGQG